MVFYAKDMIVLDIAISAITEVDYTQLYLIAPHHDEKWFSIIHYKDICTLIFSANFILKATKFNKYIFEISELIN